jgi:(1->4)-alpha-D-glucan 1-alpha-D-glucosylmutase
VLLSMNDVGGDPGRPPPTPAEFHQAMRARVRRMRRGLSATSTHDTKRSEDIRARIAVLSEIPDRWVDHTARWRRWNARHHVGVGGRTAPDAIEELYLYQTLLGVWPVGPPSADLPERVRSHMRKALREAKVHTDWLAPDHAYEAAIDAFVDAVVGLLLEPNGRTPFRADFRRLGRVVAFHGALNALSQVVLKVAAPGIPDVYQGTEVWNLRLTDPDNRAPVDVAELASSLVDLDLRAARDPAGLADDLLAHWEDGRMKQFVLSRALRFRAANPALSERGAYLPLEIDGRRADHALAFARRYRGRWAIAVVPRLTAALTEPNDFPLGTATWGTNAVILPSDAPDTWTDVFSGKVLSSSPARREGRLLRVARVLGSYPVALLAADPHGRDVV